MEGVDDSQDIKYALGSDEISVLQVMAYVFMQHREHNKAGIILKTLHQLVPHNREIRLSLAFVLTEFELIKEADDMLKPLLDENQEISLAARLLHAKLMLAQDRSGDSATEFQRYLTSMEVVDQ
jgi:predicted Zn-dependent protease